MIKKIIQDFRVGQVWTDQWNEDMTIEAILRDDLDYPIIISHEDKTSHHSVAETNKYKWKLKPSEPVYEKLSVWRLISVSDSIAFKTSECLFRSRYEAIKAAKGLGFTHILPIKYNAEKVN